MTVDENKINMYQYMQRKPAPDYVSRPYPAYFKVNLQIISSPWERYKVQCRLNQVIEDMLNFHF